METTGKVVKKTGATVSKTAEKAKEANSSTQSDTEEKDEDA